MAAKTCAERNVTAAAVSGVRRVTMAPRARSMWCGRGRFRTSQRAERSRKTLVGAGVGDVRALKHKHTRENRKTKSRQDGDEIIKI